MSLLQKCNEFKQLSKVGNSYKSDYFVTTNCLTYIGMKEALVAQQHKAVLFCYWSLLMGKH